LDSNSNITLAHQKSRAFRLYACRIDPGLSSQAGKVQMLNGQPIYIDEGACQQPDHPQFKIGDGEAIRTDFPLKPGLVRIKRGAMQ
jgi:hypothetical protein